MRIGGKIKLKNEMNIVMRFFLHYGNDNLGEIKFEKKKKENLI